MYRKDRDLALILLVKWPVFVGIERLGEWGVQAIHFFDRRTFYGLKGLCSSNDS